MLKRFWKFWQQVMVQFYQDDCLNRAASLAYTTLLSLVPLLTVSFSVLTAFPVFKGLAKNLKDFIFQHFVATSAQTAQQYLDLFIEKTSSLTAFGMLFLLIMAVLLVFSMEQAFNLIWRVKKRREDISAFFTYWGVITLVPILISIGIAITSYLLSLPVLSASGIPYLMTYIAFAVLYLALPNCKVPLRSALIAALPATILFELSKKAFTFYIVHLTSLEIIYGALATIPIFLIWLYISWLVILFGGVISYVVTKREK